jgi:hypothetical protein
MLAVSFKIPVFCHVERVASKEKKKNGLISACLEINEEINTETIEVMRFLFCYYNDDDLLRPNLT